MVAYSYPAGPQAWVDTLPPWPPEPMPPVERRWSSSQVCTYCQRRHFVYDQPYAACQGCGAPMQVPSR